MNELGYPEFQLQYWTGNICSPVIFLKMSLSTLESTIRRIVSDPGFEKSLSSFNVQAYNGGSKDLEKILEEDLKKWSEVSKTGKYSKT
jgi:tripartite-type tricarboxylate transporter receptor subunit TctC